MPKIKRSIATGWGKGELETMLDAFLTDITAQKVIIDELVADHATYKTVVDELTAWAETLGAKLNADAGVTDTNYDAVITADAPGTLTAAVTALTVTT